jgi:hypothetical protein
MMAIILTTEDSAFLKNSVSELNGVSTESACKGLPTALKLTGLEFAADASQDSD